MKLMILSPYSNAELRTHLKMEDYSGLTNFIVQKLGLQRKVTLIDKAPWVGHLINELEQVDGIELFSVSPQIKMSKSIERFNLNKTTYYFYSSDFSQAARLVGNYSLWKKLETCSHKVREIVDEIRPDIIVLFGTENLTISAPILSLLDYPIICILQTVYHKPERVKYGKPNKMLLQLEAEIVQKVKFFGTGNKSYYELLKYLNPNVSVLEYKWINGKLPQLEIPQKSFDFVNFSFNMGARKGDEDCVRALAIIKRTHPDVTLNLAGGMSPARKDYIKSIISELGLNENVSFTPMFEMKEDMYRHVLKACYAVLPVKMDLISTTIRESMFYKLPVITNITPGTPLLNKEKQCVLLAEKDNINSLANCMLQVLEDDRLSNELAKNAYEQSLGWQMDNKQRVDNLMKILHSVINYYNNGTAIPQELLFNPDRK